KAGSELSTQLPRDVEISIFAGFEESGTKALGNDNLDAGMAILRKSEAIVMVQRLDAEPVQ
ncbi:MAG: hypothetical protein SXU28_06105, partial [Pseudomonadota bacterium]|nr:hypothetical protein [Pseudomonadota bacterium]